MVQQISDILYWFIDTPGAGGAFVMLLYSTALFVFVLMARWILAGGRISDEGREKDGSHEEG